MVQHRTRPVTPEDEPFLWEMLYHAIFVPPGTLPPPRQILGYPDVARYLQGWGRGGDLGVIALDTKTGEPIGATWLRLWTNDNHGYGWVDAETPELIVAVDPTRRGQGVGTLLLERLLAEAGSRFHSVSLSVWPENRALRLYERLGFTVVGRAGRALTMVRKLGA